METALLVKKSNVEWRDSMAAGGGGVGEGVLALERANQV